MLGYADAPACYKQRSGQGARRYNRHPAAFEGLVKIVNCQIYI